MLQDTRCKGHQQAEGEPSTSCTPPIIVQAAQREDDSSAAYATVDSADEADDSTRADHGNNDSGHECCSCYTGTSLQPCQEEAVRV